MCRSNLKCLRLWRCHLIDDLDQLPIDLVKPLINLTSLSLLGYQLSGKLQSLHMITQLSDLSLNQCNLNNSDLEVISEFKSLTALNLSGNPITDLHPIENLPLEGLYLFNCNKLTQKGFDFVIPTLKKLSISGCSLIYSLEWLHSFHQLTDLYANGIKTGTLTCDTIKYLEFNMDVCDDDADVIDGVEYGQKV